MKSFLRIIEHIQAQPQIFRKIALFNQYLKETDEVRISNLLHLILFNQNYTLLNEIDLYQLFIEKNIYSSEIINNCLEITDSKSEIIALLMQNITTEEVSFTHILQKILAVKNQSEEKVKDFILQQWNSMDAQEILLFNLMITGKISDFIFPKIVYRSVALHFGDSEERVKAALSKDWNPTKAGISDVLQGKSHQYSEVVKLQPYSKNVISFRDIRNDDFIYSSENTVNAFLTKCNDNLFIQYRNYHLQLIDEQVFIENLKSLPNQSSFLIFIHAENEIQEIENSVFEDVFPLQKVKKIEIIDILLYNGCAPAAQTYTERSQIIDEIFQTNNFPGIIRKGTPSGLNEVKTGWAFSKAHLLSEPVKNFQHPLLSLTAVLTHATLGTGKRQAFYTDYTFSVFEKDKLKSILKLTAHQCQNYVQLLNTFIARNTVQKFGNMAAVKPELFFELKFEKIDLSPNSGKPFVIKNASIKRHLKSISLSDISETKDLNTSIFP